MIKKIGPIKLGNQLKAVRKAKGFTLRDVSESSKISATYLQKLESGMVNSPSPRVLQRLGESLDVSYLLLMRLVGYIPKDYVVKNAIVSGFDDDDLTKEEQKAVATFILYLKEQRD